MSDLTAVIIEDDSDLAELFAIALREAGFRTEIALNGNTALQRLEDMTPNLVVLDLFLPGVGGAEILDHIRADDRLCDVRVIVVTAGVRAAETLRDQADLVLVKPLNFIHLRDLAVRLCSSSLDKAEE